MSKKNAAHATPMTTSAAARIQGAGAKVNGGKVTSKSFPARAQRAAAKSASTGKK